MQRSTTRNKLNHGKRARTGLVFVCNHLLFRLVIFSSFMNWTLTNNYFIILIADGTICCCTRHIRDRQLQIFVTRLGAKHRPPSLTNIQATRRSLQRDPGPDHSLFNVYLSAVQYTAVSTASLCGLRKLTLVSEARHLFFAPYSQRSSNAGLADTSK